MSRVNRYEYKDWKAFGIRTKQNREKIGMTKEKFAELINRSENYVAELEKGNTSCSVHTLHQISKVLKISTDNLLYGEVEINNEYTYKEIMLEIIERCNEEELKVIQDLVIAVYPNFNKILKHNKS